MYSLILQRRFKFLQHALGQTKWFWGVWPAIWQFINFALRQCHAILTCETAGSAGCKKTHQRWEGCHAVCDIVCGTISSKLALFLFCDPYPLLVIASHLRVPLWVFPQSTPFPIRAPGWGQLSGASQHRACIVFFILVVERHSSTIWPLKKGNER